MRLIKQLISNLGDELGSRAIIVAGRDRFISGRVLTNDCPSEAYFNVVRRWFKDCGFTHSECGGHEILASRLPDRVIDVALHGGDPHLINGSGLISRYATLSHCWGDVACMATLTCNLDQRMDQHTINGSAENLPRSYNGVSGVHDTLFVD